MTGQNARVPAQLVRMTTFLAPAIDTKATKDARTHVKTLTRDVQSLLDHSSFIASKLSYLQDATLGLINNEQNNIIKIMSVAAMVFLPPTLIASIYGMNFHFMPELDWPAGYFVSLILMVISAVVPYCGSSGGVGCKSVRHSSFGIALKLAATLAFSLMYVVNQAGGHRAGRRSHILSRLLRARCRCSWCRSSRMDRARSSGPTHPGCICAGRSPARRNVPELRRLMRLPLADVTAFSFVRRSSQRCSRRCC